ncbi:receptor-type tyrosine-protein phosphatase kappa [Elysia marginata]|uniref:protein-tyrosine-phosphatase n=1 Tax=Elysia marginata TaxID=1093978 RepID=A0AAV4INS0_9GAST|nr:receptor-type tyrosine-protein phosphatase kappa [Elysia marginata]
MNMNSNIPILITLYFRAILFPGNASGRPTLLEQKVLTHIDTYRKILHAEYKQEVYKELVRDYVFPRENKSIRKKRNIAHDSAYTAPDTGHHSDQSNESQPSNFDSAEDDQQDDYLEGNDQDASDVLDDNTQDGSHGNHPDDSSSDGSSDLRQDTSQDDSADGSQGDIHQDHGTDQVQHSPAFTSQSSVTPVSYHTTTQRREPVSHVQTQPLTQADLQDSDPSDVGDGRENVGQPSISDDVEVGRSDLQTNSEEVGGGGVVLDSVAVETTGDQQGSDQDAPYNSDGTSNSQTNQNGDQDEPGQSEGGQGRDISPVSGDVHDSVNATLTDKDEDDDDQDNIPSENAGGQNVDHASNVQTMDGNGSPSNEHPMPGHSSVIAVDDKTGETNLNNSIVTDAENSTLFAQDNNTLSDLGEPGLHGSDLPDIPESHDMNETTTRTEVLDMPQTVTTDSLTTRAMQTGVRHTTAISPANVGPDGAITFRTPHITQPLQSGPTTLTLGTRRVTIRPMTSSTPTTQTTTTTTSTTTTLPSTSRSSTVSTATNTIIVTTLGSRTSETDPHKISISTPVTVNTVTANTTTSVTTPTTINTEISPANIPSVAPTRHPLPTVGSSITLTTVTQGSLPRQPNNTTPSQGSQLQPVGESQRNYVELKLDLTWPAFCDISNDLKEEVASLLVEHQPQFTSDQIRYRERFHCDATDIEQVSVQIYIESKMRHYDRELTLTCAQTLQNEQSLAQTTILQEKLVSVEVRTGTIPTEDQEGQSTGNGRDNTGDAGRVGDTGGGGTEGAGNGQDTNQGGESANQPSKGTSGSLADPGVLVAIVLACIGVVSCLAVAVLQIAVRRRNRLRTVLKRTIHRSGSMNSSDSIQLAAVTKSRPNSGLFNPALDITDAPLEPSHKMNLKQLMNFCSDEIKMMAEFEKLPYRMPRLSVVPTGEEDKNRFANVLPLALTRVKLLQDGPEPRSSYINANYVTGPDSQCQYYIATQAPTEDTIADFWTMVWQQGTKAIVMLTQMEEEGQTKCVPYWPDFVGKSAAQKHGDFLIELKNKEVCQEYIASELKISHLRKIEHRPIFHFWYTCWPTKSLPEPISLVKLVLDSRPKYEDAGVPVVVHCSPGTGRTGTFIALDQCMHQLETRRSIDVMKTVYSLRQERAGAVQNKEQYILLYQAAREYASIIESPGPSAASSATTLHALLPSS